MKFCQPHWNQLRHSINQAGMGNLGAKTGQEAVTRIESELKGTQTDSTFDPLMAAHNRILVAFLEPLGADGVYIFAGDYCPLCELGRLNPDKPNLVENWVQGVTAEMLSYCKDKGLLPPSN